MTPSPSLRAMMAAAGHALRRDAWIALGAALLALIPMVMLVGWVMGGWPRPSLAPLLLDIALFAGAAMVLTRARRGVHRTMDEAAVARAAETQLELPPGALRGALELGRALPAGASQALAARSERILASRIGSATTAQLTGDLGMQWRRKRHTALASCALLIAVVCAVGFATPTRSRAAWAPLLHPVRNLRPPTLAALVVEPGNVNVMRSGSIDIRIRAQARSAVTLHWRVQGDIVRDRLIPVLGDTAAWQLTHLDGVTEYWVDAPDGAETPRFHITLTDPLLLAELAVEIIYPAYLNRANERYDGELPALELPQGTELMLHGRATRPLAHAELRADSAAGLTLNVNEAAFSSRWVPVSSGLYSWKLRDVIGNGLAVEPPPIAITMVRDAAPGVTITFPGVDTVFGPELQLAIAAEATDDHGVMAASLVTWRVTRTGTRDPSVETPLPVNTGDRVELQTVLDASERNMTAGDTLKYFIRVRDNSPAGQTAESRTYNISQPGINELRNAAEEQTRQLMKANDEIARAAAKLQEETRNTERRTRASNTRRDNGGKGGESPAQPNNRMQFTESQAAQKVLDQQQALMNSMDEMRAKVDALQKSLENAGLQDADMQQKLAEFRKLYDQALTPELRARMEQLKQAIDKLDPKEVETALQQLQQQQDQLKQQLDRSMELMKRAAAEQQMNKLTQETKELARQQDALASQQNEQKDAKTAAQQQQELARKDDALAKEMDQLREQLAKQGESQAASQTQKAVDSTKSAQQSMQRAVQQSADGRAGDAQKQKKQAAQQLDDAAKQLDKARQEMVQGWKDETQQSMQQATRDALSLAQRQQSLKDQMDRSGSQPPSIPQPAPPRPPDGKQNGGSKQPVPSASQGSKPQQGQQGRSGGGGGQQQQPGQQPGGRQGGAPGQSGQPQPAAPGQQSDLENMRSEQSALQQGLQQLSRNLQDTGDRSAQVSREVGASLGKANQSMQQTQDALQSATPDGQMPSERAGQTVDALNKLALSLLKNSQEVQQSKDGTGAQQRMEQMSELAKQQGSLNGQGSSIMPMNLSPGAMSQQVRKLGQSQQQIAQQLNAVGKNAARDPLLGRIDELAKEAAAIAQEMQSGRLEPQTLARQEKLFHRLLDAGRSMQKDEVSQERVAERPGAARLSQPAALDPRLFKDGTKFRVPTPEELRALPPAYRKLILDYFERLNRPATADKSK